MFKYILALSSFLSFTSFGQEINVHGKILADTVQIGERFKYALTVSYPASLSVVFPDSSYDYTPYDFEKKEYYITRTSNNISRDSAVYYFTTFEIDSVQFLALPVFVVTGRDSTIITPQADTLYLRHLIKGAPPSVEAKDLPLKTNTDYMKVKWLLNYQLLLIIGAGLVIVLVIAWLIFGKRIRRHYRLKRLLKNHREFLDRFARQVGALNEANVSVAAETALVTWKRYMENLMGTSFTRLTSKEIVRVVRDENLGNALRAIDRIVYAKGSASVEMFEVLRTFSQDQFARKTTEVKNG